MNNPINYQKLWDTILIEEWHKESSVAVTVQRFARESEYFSLENHPPYGRMPVLKPTEIMTIMVEKLAIKRVYFGKWKISIRAYIDRDSPQLSSCLWGGTASDEKIIEAIGRFRWRRRRAK